MSLQTRLTDPAAWFTAETAWRAALTSRRAPSPPQGGADLFLCVVDHFEPSHGQPSREVALARLDDWLVHYPKIASQHRDSEGRHPPHGFFYPWDEYDETEFARLADLCADGWGEIELHLHHRDDTPGTLRAQLRDAVTEYRRFGALSAWPDGRPAWGFIHGDWALNNSRATPKRNFCGVNDEIAVLKEEGCYADLTFPAWRHTAQPRQVNDFYFAHGTVHHPKGHDRGRSACVGGDTEDGLLLLQGPLVPWTRKGGLLPRIGVDDGDLAATNRYHPARLDRWIRAGIGVKGRPDRIFVKLHSHGAPDANRNALLGEDLDALFSDAEARYNDGQRWRLHYVTARELYNLVVATMRGDDGDLTVARDFILLPPPHRVARFSA